MRTHMHHVRVAVGRAYSDVPPVRGVYRGNSAGQTMKVDLRVHPALAMGTSDAAHGSWQQSAHDLDPSLIAASKSIGYAATMFESE